MTNPKDESGETSESLVNYWSASLLAIRIAMETNPKARASLRLWGDPEFKSRMSEAQRERWQDPELRKLASANSKNSWQNPEFRANGLVQLADARAKGSAAAKKKWDEDPERRAKGLAHLADIRSKAVAASKKKIACYRLHGEDCGCWQNSQEDIARAKLTANQMRILLDFGGLSGSQIAEIAGVSLAAVYKLVQGSRRYRRPS